MAVGKSENPATGADSERIRAQLRKWQERLLDLTKANPLLGINRSRVSKLLVTHPDALSLFERFVVGDDTLRMPLVRKGVSTKARVDNDDQPAPEEYGAPEEYVVDEGDLTFDAKPIDLRRRLHRIDDNARTTVQERGVTTLHLTFGVLRWEDTFLGPSVAPLWMVPCQLESHGSEAPLRLLRADEEMQLNPALELYLRERHRVGLPPIPEEPQAGGLAQYLEAVRSAVPERGWSVEYEVWFSTYTFESLVIYQDLKAMADVALRNEIVAAFARAKDLPEGSEAMGEEDLDQLPTPERVPVAVLPTDSSQLRALALATSGRNLIVHGPPGTGKSQTITNLIADALGRNKKVLFVSAKMAALDVVHDRLVKLGLGGFCLEAHSTKAGKARIIEVLKRTLEATTNGERDPSQEHLEDLLRVRDQLNEYVREVHLRREPLGQTFFQAVGRLEELRTAPDVQAPLPWQDLLTVSRRELGDALDVLSNLGAQASVFDNRVGHPWRGLAVRSGAEPLRDPVESDLRAIREPTRQLLDALSGLAPLLGTSALALSLNTVSNLTQTLKALSTLVRLPPGWYTRSVPELNAAGSLLDTAAINASELVAKKRSYEEALDLPVDEAQGLLAPIGGQFRGWARIARPSYWKWRALVRKHLRKGAASDVGSLRSYLIVANQLAELEGWFNDHEAELAEHAQADNQGDAQAFTRDATRCRVAGLLREHVTIDRYPETLTLTDTMRQAAATIASVTVNANLKRAVSAINALWPDGFVDGSPVAEARLPDLLKRCEEVLGAVSKIQEWIALQYTLDKCRTLKLSGFLQGLGTVSSREARAALEKRFYTMWAEVVIQRSQSLVAFAVVQREELIQRFRSLDEATRRYSLSAIQEMASVPGRQVSRAQSNLGHAGEVGILRRELQKRRRIKPLRQLFAEIPHVLQALKPCMLMSPVSVSTFLKPGSVSFDLVVFDEASQLPTQQAIPAILRAKQVVVAGDENQLPPTSFFDASFISDDNDEPDDSVDLEPLESLLDDCKAVIPVFDPSVLRWHYRSRDERLIKFSNHYFYENSLITFPSVSTGDTGQGVQLVYVPEGVWDRGRSRTNRREARQVAELIVEQLEHHPERSLGVVGMNVTQREAIEYALDDLILLRADLAPLLDPNRPEPFFVKALENVQGDERDTIIISVGYGKTADGALSFNFGPLNQEGGWRRLNVLVTRARYLTILVTSLRSMELDGVNPNNRGAVALRNYITYAERDGGLPAVPSTFGTGETNDFEDAVAEALRDRGLQVDQQVGASIYRIDLAIRDPRNPHRYVLGVECDGATYHSAKTARDRDLLRAGVLFGLGWKLHRVWSTEWFRDREKAIAGALRSLEQAMQAPLEKSVVAPPQPEVAPSAEPRPAQAKVPWSNPDNLASISRRFLPGESYRKYRSSGNVDRNLLLGHDYVQLLAADVVRIVEFEGPIHEDLLTKRLKEVHGVARAGSNVQANISNAIQAAVRAKKVQRTGRHFLRRSGATLRTFRLPGDGVRRQVGMISPDELELAIRYVVEDQFGYPYDALPRAVATLLGDERLNTAEIEVITHLVNGLVGKGELRMEGHQVYLA